MWESLQTKKVYYKTNIPIPGTNLLVVVVVVVVVVVPI